MKINKINEIYFKYRKIIIRNRTAFRKIKLNKYYKKKKVLYCNKNLLILNDGDLLLKFIRESHDFLIYNHFDITRTIELLKRYYC